MNATTSGRGFEQLDHPAYLPPHTTYRLVAQSSAIGDYEDAMRRPGSSFLWLGEHHHLDRSEVAELVQHLQSWLATGSLVVAEDAGEAEGGDGEKPALPPREELYRRVIERSEQIKREAEGD